MQKEIISKGTSQLVDSWGLTVTIFSLRSIRVFEISEMSYLHVMICNCFVQNGEIILLMFCGRLIQTNTE